MSVDGPDGPLTGRAVQRRRLALLAILASGQFRGRGVSRERLVSYVWPEADAERGRPLLSDSVYRINQAVGGEAIVAVGDELRLNDSIVSSDVAEFERAVEAGERERAASTYAGVLLDGAYLVSGSEFERWVDGERARLSRLYEGVLDALAQMAESAGDLARAACWWRRLATHDPYSSRVALRLMHVLAAMGDSAAAVRHAAVHTTLLQEELGVAANAAVLRLAERLKAEPVEPAIDASTPPEPSPSEQLSVDAGASAAAEPVPNADPVGSPPTAALPPLKRVANQAAVLVGLAFVLVVATGLFLWDGQRTVTAPTASIAVLPFTDLSPGRDNAYFSDGMTEELINTLTQLEGVHVAARMSAFAYRDGRGDVREVGRKLGVATVLVGSVRKCGNKIRITVQLANTADGFQLWSQSYDRELDDELAVQDDISRTVVNMVRDRLVPARLTVDRFRFSDRGAGMVSRSGRLFQELR